MVSSRSVYTRAPTWPLISPREQEDRGTPTCPPASPGARTLLLEGPPPNPTLPRPAEGPPAASEIPVPLPCSYIRRPAAAHRTQPSWWPGVKAPGLSQGSPVLLNFSLIRAVWQQHKICSYPLSQ